MLERTLSIEMIIVEAKIRIKRLTVKAICLPHYGGRHNYLVDKLHTKKYEEKGKTPAKTSCISEELDQDGFKRRTWQRDNP